MEQEITIRINSFSLPGNLTFLDNCQGLVIFAHGSGSSRLSLRNQMVAKTLQDENISTLLFDLLTTQEAAEEENRFNIALLADRLRTATHWALSQEELKSLPIGYFGVSTGAAAALQAAADLELRNHVKTIVSRGGRPDLALPFLDKVDIPTLLIVGELDEIVIELNRQAYHLLPGEKDLNIISGATHLFEEPGTLERVAELATNWFKKYLR